MRIETRDGGVAAFWSARLGPGEVGFAWLGQAGFALRDATTRVLIDPYLSDALAEKYRGAAFSHSRMMPPPVVADALDGLDAVLITHRHGDHLDAATLSILARRNPECRFVAPAAESAVVERTEIPRSRTVLADAGQSHRLSPSLAIDVLPAAHETLAPDNQGRHPYLGYVVRFGAAAVYHSGDCVPFEGLVERVRSARPQVALLPVNGRDEQRRSRGVPGNFHFDEAVQLAVAAGIKWLVPHHFGMFDFNTVDRSELERQAATVRGVACLVPCTEQWYLLRSAEEK